MSVYRVDRLSALVARFSLDISIQSSEKANLAILPKELMSGMTARIVFSPVGCLSRDDLIVEPIFLAHARWGGRDNPLVSALPDRVEMDVLIGSEVASLVALLLAENQGQRCGSGSVVNRLCEVLLVRMMRQQVSEGTTDVGLLGGLADKSLSRAIVAMHEEPGRGWRIDSLAEIAGLSQSRFADRFTKTVGQSPMAYLRKWRMTLARQDIEKGDRIQAVASRYGYASSEALTRAFRRQFGLSPSRLRRANELN